MSILNKYSWNYINSDGVFYINTNGQRNTTYFIDLLNAYDEYDGDISESLYVVSDNYLKNRSMPGEYEVLGQ